VTEKTGKIVFDHLNHEISIRYPLKKVVSLVPSITELLFDLDWIPVGRTKFCIHPKEKVTDLRIVGGTKNFRFKIIDEINPDLIIANKEENYPEGIDRLKENYQVWISDVVSIEDSINLIKDISILIDNEEKGNEVIATIKSVLNKVENTRKEKVLYLIWKDPFIAVGSDTYINSFLEHIGYKNIIQKSRYPEVSLESLKSLEPDVVLLSSEPYPFSEKHLLLIRNVFKNSYVKLVNGEFYSWYGST
jgi:ABC-type Fe3+-hydroxamate transport system substrate-binding protein